MGAAGKQAVEDLNAYVEGINAYIAAANLDTKLKPAEYSFINKPMEAWKPTDIVAIASLVGGIFGKGGGNELHSALTMEAMVERMGTKAGQEGLGRLPLEERPGSADHDLEALPVRDPQRLRQAGPGAAGRKIVFETPAASGSSATAAPPASTRSAAGSPAGSKKRATPRTGSWSRRRTRPTATRSR